MARKNIFVAVGGSGTKVAEALARLLMLGFPLDYKGEEQDEIRIWRVDADESSGAFQELMKVLRVYKELIQPSLQTGSNKLWCPALPVVDEAGQSEGYAFLHPMKVGQVSGQKLTLRELLNTGDNRENQDILDLFYKPEDLELDLSEGFYQKPFIGSAAMAVFLERALHKDNPDLELTKDLRLAELTQAGDEVRFFICGSLHGGTGAACVPVLGEYLKNKQPDKWTVAGCLLTPYSMPPTPNLDVGPKRDFKDARELEDAVNEAYARLKNDPQLKLGEDNAKKLIQQLLTGSLAKQDDIILRAKNSLKYYMKSGSRSFHAIYYVGLPSTRLYDSDWSNGGSSQVNPPQAAEVVAALSALHFFGAAAPPRGKDGQPAEFVPASTIGMSKRWEQLCFKDLPQYTTRDGKSIQPERAILTSAIVAFLIQNNYPWDMPAKNWEKCPLADYYEKNAGFQDRDKAGYAKAFSAWLGLLYGFENSKEQNRPMGLVAEGAGLVAPEDLNREARRRGWSEQSVNEIKDLFRRLPAGSRKDELNDKFEAGWGKKSEPITIEDSCSIEFTTKKALEIKTPSMERGPYIRALWKAVYESALSSPDGNGGRR